MPASEIIAACGGYTEDSVKLIAGGPMMGKQLLMMHLLLIAI